jgi:hypothetical protein
MKIGFSSLSLWGKVRGLFTDQRAVTPLPPNRRFRGTEAG